VKTVGLEKLDDSMFEESCSVSSTICYQCILEKFKHSASKLPETIVSQSLQTKAGAIKMLCSCIKCCSQPSLLCSGTWKCDFSEDRRLRWM